MWKILQHVINKRYYSLYQKVPTSHFFKEQLSRKTDIKHQYTIRQKKKKNQMSNKHMKKNVHACL